MLSRMLPARAFGARGFSALPKITTLSNGVRVATQQTKGPAASVGVYVDVGVRDETPDMFGAGKLFEKVALTGTKTRAGSKFASELESVGGVANVEVGRERTALQVSVPKGGEKKSLELIADALLNGGADAKAVEAAADGETGATIEDVILDRLHQAAFRDCGLGNSIAVAEGTPSSIQAFQSMFCGSRSVVVAVGDVNHDEIVKTAESSLGKLAAGQGPVVPNTPYFLGSEMIYRNDDMGPTAYVGVGWPSVPYKSADSIAFGVMRATLGEFEKNSSIMPDKISGNRMINAMANRMNVGCTDRYQTHLCQYRDTGMLALVGACDEVAVRHMVLEFMFNTTMLAYSTQEEEIARGKRLFKGSLLAGQGSVAKRTDTIGTQLLAYGRVIPSEELITRIDAVDRDEVRRVAWQYIQDAEIVTTALGPLHGMPHYYEVRKMTHWVRY
uniref:Mitochondrial-processing peptidase subunit alpha n=1 Tax=Oxyrrhis marina TaxID=2969 RepID=A0A7S4LQ71_OXYMA|mmetsp:Transcript_19978/g.48667  ORF Transcript_19978/g.48667 Transcript_19978/m.48667 type:complete len:444 (+) Transcript_19978:69-1400(+)